MNKGQRKQPVYVEGKLCKKCGTTTKIQVNRKKPKTGERYTTVRCKKCINARSEEYIPYDNLKWQKENREHLRSYQREFYKDKYAERNGVSAKRLRERMIYKNEKKEIAEFYRNRPKGYHVDHIVPLMGEKVSGLHTISNLQYLPASENMSKKNKYEIV